MNENNDKLMFSESIEDVFDPEAALTNVAVVEIKQQFKIFNNETECIESFSESIEGSLSSLLIENNTISKIKIKTSIVKASRTIEACLNDCITVEEVTIKNANEFDYSVDMTKNKLHSIESLNFSWDLGSVELMFKFFKKND